MAEDRVAAPAYVCWFCGMAVHKWASQSGPGWKHAAGGPRRGCGLQPRAVEQEAFESELADEIDVLHRNGWSIDDAREEILARRRDDQ